MDITSTSTSTSDKKDKKDKKVKKFRYATKTENGELKLLEGRGRPSKAATKILVKVSGEKLKALKAGETVFA